MPTHQRSMIKEQALFSSVIKRLFSGRVPELLGELLQNSQRAGATRVEISFPTPGSCAFADNGHGLDSLDDLSKLLVLADSHYLDEGVEENQSPLGIGLYSLVANDQVARLCIESKCLRFAFETGPWLADQEYRESWEDRVGLQQEEDPQGFRLSIEGSEALMNEIRKCLLSVPLRYNSSDCALFRSDHNPVCGYAGILEVYLDGAPITAQLPPSLTLLPAEIATSYQGNEIRISPFAPGVPGVGVNWYGQVVLDWRYTKGFQAYLIVRQGRPVTPQAPTRLGLIQDEALETLYRWIEDQIFAWVCSQEAPSAALVKRLYAINAQRANRECPFAVAQAWKPLPGDYTFDSHDQYARSYHTRSYYELGEQKPPDDGESDQLGSELVVRKAALGGLLFLDEMVTCALPASHPAQPYTVRRELEKDPGFAERIVPEDFELGLTSLLRATGLQAYRPGVGIAAEQVMRFWWKPGAMVDDYHTTALGEWAVQRDPTPDEGLPDLSWQPFEVDEVFVVDETQSFDIEEARWIIGLASSDKMVAFLQQYGHAAFSLDDEEPDDSEDSYRASLDVLIRSYLPDTIARTEELDDLPRLAQKFLPDGYDALAATWRFLYDKRSRRLQGVRLSFRNGYKKELRFY